MKHQPTSCPARPGSLGIPGAPWSPCVCLERGGEEGSVGRYVVGTGGGMCVCVCVCVLEECGRVCGVCAVYAHINLLAGVSFVGLHTISSGPHTE